VLGAAQSGLTGMLAPMIRIALDKIWPDVIAAGWRT